jgi:hypothetical protein
MAAIVALADAKNAVGKYIEACATSEELSELVGVLPALSSAALAFERATAPRDPE